MGVNNDALRATLRFERPAHLCHFEWGYWPETLARWRSIKDAASATIVELGGTISHQHGVGRDHRAWLPAEKGDLGIAAATMFLCGMLVQLVVSSLGARRLFWMSAAPLIAYLVLIPPLAMVTSKGLYCTPMLSSAAKPLPNSQPMRPRKPMPAPIPSALEPRKIGTVR